MKSAKKLLTIFIICVMTISAFGIAQVTHMCKMAADQVTATGCAEQSCDSHNCCQPSSGDNCCTDVVKYYHQKVNTTLNPVLKLQPEPAIVTLLLSLIPDSENYVTFLETSFQPDICTRSGKFTLLETHTLLI